MRIVYKRFNKTFDSLPEAVKYLVDDAPDYYDGDIEANKAKIEKLTEIVAALTGMLTDEQKANLSCALDIERKGVK